MSDVKNLVDRSKQVYLLSKPNLVTWEITTACNKRCSFCYHSNRYLDSHQHISDDTISHSLDFISEMNAKGVALTGGEPILHPNFRRILDSLYNIVPNITVFTNGLALTDSVCDLFSNRKISINYSFDFHDSSNFSLLQRICSLISPDKLKVSVVYSGEDVDSFVHCIKEIRDRFSGDIQVNYVQFKGQAEYSSQALKNMISLSKKLIELNLKSDLNIKGQYISDPLINYFRNSNITSFNCSICNNLKIDINGDVYPCPFFTDSSFSLGSVFSQNRLSMFSIDGTKYSFLKSYLYDRITASKCETCKWVRFCGGGCLLCIEGNCKAGINPISCALNQAIYDYINSIWNLYS